MKLLRKLTAFILAFSLLAGTVAVVSAAVYPGDSASALTYNSEAVVSPEPAKKAEIASVAADSYTPRLTAPAYSSKYYYSDSNVFYKYGYGMPNCTCYAWGRAYELLGKAPKLCIYSAYQWFDYNLSNGYYPYGWEPRLGAIACWSYSYGGGHVAVVEKIENGKITFSNSAYGGDEFYLTTAPVDDPSAGRSSWYFQGYIYVGDFGDAVSGDTDSAKDSELNGDVYRITSDTGVNLRSGAGTSYSVLTSIDYLKEVTVTETKKAGGYTWGYTAYRGQSGWFVLDYAKLVKKAEILIPASTEAPTEAPTAAPTQAPTAAPTAAPTQAPTAAPTAAPTQAPTAAPTVRPTQAPTQAPTTPKFEIEKRPDTNVKLGDLDGDGMVTIMDATRIQLIIAELYVPTKYMLIVGDYDGDGIFSILDASKIRHDLAFELI